MSRRTIPALVVALATAGGFLACSETTPTTPDADRQDADAIPHRVAGYGAEVPLTSPKLSLAFTKQHGRVHPTGAVARLCYMGLALYEALIAECRTTDQSRGN